MGAGGAAREERAVAVVGAGLAGLACAAGLVAGGADPAGVLVLEALGRAGGRTLTASLDGEAVDVGACWVCPRQKRVHRLLKEHGLDVIEQQTAGVRVGVRSAGGLLGWLSRALGRGWTPPATFTTLYGLPLWDLLQYVLLTRRVNRLAAAIPAGRPWDAKGAQGLDSKSVSSWLEEEGAPHNSTARGLMASTVQSVFCADADAVSMLLFLTTVQEEGGVEVLLEEAQSQRVVQGNGTLSARLAASLQERGVEIRLGVQVVGCAHSAEGGGVLTTRDGAKVSARRVVLAMPPPAIAELALEPPLGGPLAAEQAAQRMGKVIKVVVEFTECWWRGAHCAMADPELLEATLAFDVSPPRGHRHILAVFFFGAKAEKWSAAAGKSDAERREEAVRCARLLFGDPGNVYVCMYRVGGAQPPCEVVGSVEGDWPAVPGIRGGYQSFPRLGSTVASQAYSCSAPTSCLHFASTENATHWRGYMDGAVQSGERAAAEVLQAL